MEDQVKTNEESLDSVPGPTYEALRGEEIFETVNSTVDKEQNINLPVKAHKGNNDEPYDSEQDMEKESNISQNYDNETNEQDISLEYEEEEEDFGEEYLQDGAESFVEPITADSKSDALIVESNDGMIKKIKICHNAKDINDKTEYKRKTFISSSQPEGNNAKLLTRSSTPMSREFVALQKSVNESKILTEFVTDSEKPRKLRAKDSASSLPPSNADHSYSSTRKGSPEKGNADDNYNNLSSSQSKRQQSKRYVPLKDNDFEGDTSTNLRPRSRSKSMHNSEFNTSSVGSHKKLKRWPSEERLHKRTNMRSENSEFAQKQAEFLQRVIHACENPRKRSRSRSCGRKTPNSLTDQSFDGGSGGSSGPQQKTNKTYHRERYSRRHKYDMGSENDEPQLLGENNSEQPDEEYINESQTSLIATNSLDDNNLEVEAHLKSVWLPSPKLGYDSFCWKCRESKVNLCCCKCIRSFHAACVKISKFDNIWLCPECNTVENMLNNPKRSRRNEMSLDLLSQLLSFALKRMRYTKGHYNFVMPYENSAIYKKYIVNPVSLSSLQTKIEAKEFRCAEEFVNETKWMLHNAYILNKRNNKITLAAKSIFKICRQEANEIETCAECYLNANTRTDWFVDVCSQPHMLLWAKLKGFPYWPAKAMGLGLNSLVNVRFFGEHDRAFVPLKDCYLYSEQDPNAATGKKSARELADCIKEVEEHIEKIKSKVGAFKYAPYKMAYDPTNELNQLVLMMPGVLDFIKKQQSSIIKPSLQFKIYKTADNNLSIVQKASTTPELNSSQPVESDEKEKKKKLSCEGHEATKKDDTTAPPAKYEVISKVTSDESNSSKLSTVILKRKSVNGDSKKPSEEEIVDLPLPKMTKIEDESVEQDLNRLNAKRKLESQLIEKPKAKHTKLELKVPILTIKTSISKDLMEIPNKEPDNKVSSLAITSDSANSKKTPDTQPTVVNKTNETSHETKKVMENLVKHKQGVTIKKIAKDPLSTSTTEESTLESNKEIPKETSNENANVAKGNKQVPEDEKARENLKVNNILKGLVPFVEVKKEVLSDNEQDAEKQKENLTDKVSGSPEINKEKNPQKVIEIPVNNSQPENINTSNDKEQSKSNVTEEEKSAEKENASAGEVISQVKQELLSDEEEANETDKINLSAANQPIAKNVQIKLNDSGGSIAEKPANSTTGDVRIVGDTTIQKLPNKNNTAHYYVYSTNSSSNNNTGNTNNNSGVTTKRFTLKGVPYSPLPTSALPKITVSKSFLQPDAQPRAKKSFPQHSPPADKFRPSSNNQNTITQMSPPATTPHLDQKRTMGKNTMVTIPVDVAANRTSTSSGTIIIGSIPVPPLTAVSKTLPCSLAHNSTARNSPATITVSGTSGSLTTPSIMVQVKASTTIGTTTSSTTIRNSPITVTSSSPISLSSSLSSTSVTTTTMTTALNPLKMTTPPPLAGLSKNNVITTTQTNGVIDPNTTTGIPSLPTTQQASMDSHILGGLVTPTLASAITDVICRGPPKLAARPSGPLQSEGYPMFQSQAGPVCKRLVENVHKLTDFFMSVVEDTMGEMAQGDDASLQAKITLLTIEMERNKQAHEQEMAELKRTSDLMLCEMRKSMENEKTRLVVEVRKQCELERLRSVEETKRKQWCANCFREANFYCCWNTSYCDYPCQQLHWSRHSHTCAQTRPNHNETTIASTTTTQAEVHAYRHYTNKSNSTITLSSMANFNKSSTSINQKKEKGITKNIMPSSITTVTTPSASRPEVLKLPTNTYLRPVASNLNSQTLRCNTTYSLPIQRFNAPMPITTPANSSSPQTFTIVQQGNNWVMSSNTTNNSSNSNSATNSQNASLTQVSGQTRSTGTGTGNTVITNKSAKTQIRYH